MLLGIFGVFMNNKSLVLIVIGLGVCILVTGLMYDYFFVSNTVFMKNQTFEDINVSVPSESIFFKNPNSDMYSSGGAYGVWVIPFNLNNSSYSSVDDFQHEFIKEDMSEINISNLNDNAKAFVLNNSKNDVAVIITNDENNMAIIVRTTNGQDLAVQMANSVLFPN
jgi:translation elongation factor P/translation initiation factor 5A